jgi:amino acid adenylation domain-containing protein/non-ribosomal peptide synthase protein (TIGR01720 family)
MNKSFINLFEEQVIKTPDQIAVVFEGERCTYKELNERANKLAHYLRFNGVIDETLVPLYIERGVNMMVGILGIMKAGAAYVPIDTDFPLERIDYMLQDTAAKIVVTSTGTAYRISGKGAFNIVEIETISGQSTDNLPTNVSGNLLAYVIYTSGSTGAPKGVMVEHRNLVDYITGLSEKIQISECRSFALVSTIATDLGNTVIYASLASGGALHLFTKESASDVELLHGYFATHQIECLKIVPSHWKALNLDDQLLLPKKLLVFGGEALPEKFVQDILKCNAGCRIVNHYGPTETTIGKLLHVVEPAAEYEYTIPIGKPFSNTKVLVLNNNLKFCPIGVAGQLYITGAGLARGYLNNEELTREKFIQNPFSKKEGSLMYSTGDLVKYLPDGNISFIGRVDNQVKIRGYRIELGEIENMLQQSSLVSQAVVLARDDKQGNKQLVAYIIPEDDFDKEAIIDYLKEKLPVYMLPALWMQLESLPLTANGKVDRQALPDPAAAEISADQYMAPRNETEIKLAEIWQELLDIEQVGIHDNYFELGGDSIITIQLVSRARRNGVELQIGDVFTYQTIARLSALLEQRADTTLAASGEQFELSGASGLLPIQQWYFEKNPVDISHFNQSLLLGISKSVTESILKRCLEQLTAHHDALRFKYYKKEEQWNQVYETEVSVVFSENLQSVSPDKLADAITAQSEKYQRSLDIEKGELIKVVLLLTPGTEVPNRLLIVIHHLVVDGVSWRILVEDIELLLTGLITGGKTDLGTKTSSYRQWYDALVKYGQSNRLASQKIYWEKVIKKFHPLPVDKANAGAIKLADTGNISMQLDAVKTKQLLQEVPKLYHTEIIDILLSALAKTLANWAGTNALTIGMEGHGREDIDKATDTSRTVGWFTTHYPLLLELNPNNSEAHLIKTVKEQLRRVPDKGLGYGVLKYINKEAAFIITAAPDIIFNYLGQADNVLASSQLFSMVSEPAGTERSDDYIVSNKLAVNGMIQGGELILNWTYSSLHFEKETVAKIVEAFKNNLELLIQHCIGQQDKSIAEFTPADFGLGNEITFRELDTFLDEAYNGKARRQSLQSMYRLSGLQQGMLFHGLYEGGGGVYMRQLGADLIGLDTDVFQQSWAVVCKNHSILRSGFYHDVFNIPVQCVYNNVTLPLEVFDFSLMNAAEQVAAISKYESETSARGFDFKTPPLMRVALIRLNTDRYRMIWTWHHILIDGWSMTILMEEFLKNYHLLVAGKPVIIGEEDRFEDYIRYIERSDKDKAAAYWNSYLTGIEQSTNLPFIAAAGERNKGVVGKYKVMQFSSDAAATDKIQDFTHAHRITLNTLMQGVWSYLLHKYTGQLHVAFGVIVSGRPDEMQGMEQRVGMYINTLPLHAELKAENGVVEWLQTLQQEQVKSREYQYTSLQEIQNHSAVAGSLFDSILVFENYPVSKLTDASPDNLRVENIGIQEQNNYPLTININNADNINIAFSYNSSLLDEVYVKQMLNHFEHVLLQVVNNAEAILSDLVLLTNEEQHKLLAGFNNTASAYPADKSIVALFEQQVTSTPDAIAVVFDRDQISYKELNERSNQLAHYLIARGVQQQSMVPVCIERSLEMMVGILGILKAGAVYVPIDPEYPQERILYMLEDIGYSVIVTSSGYQEIFSTTTNKSQLICLDKLDDLLFTCPDKNLNLVISACDLAYIIYTSGSTGKPKGVMVNHRNVVSLVCGVDYVDFAATDVLLSTGSASFDATTFEYWGMLLNGGQLVLCAENRLLDSELLKEEISSRKVNKMWFTAGWFNQLVDTDIAVFSTLQTILVGGEKLSEPHIEKIRQAYPLLDVLNGYGPTENTTFSLVFKFTGDAIRNPIPIGQPLANRKAFILDSNQQLLPIGVPGEIVVGGAGLSVGYLNRTELTAEKFKTVLFNKNWSEKIYLTGDQGRLLPDGNIEYLGRIDQQVKVRGFRIELGEIEAALLQHEMISQAVVVAKEDKEGHRRLIGYVVMSGYLEKETIVTYLKGKLPEYMVPALWLQMETLPLTRNGKIDRGALPDPGISDLSTQQYVAPRNEMEQTMATIWQDLLGLDQVGIEDNFFELGGDSIVTIQLVSRTKHAGFELQVADVFTHQNIAGLSAVVAQRAGKLLVVSGEQSLLNGPCGLLPIQQWYFEKKQAAVSHFNQSVLLAVDKKVTASILQQVLQQLIAHHDALRFKYQQQDGQWLQEYGDCAGELITEDLRSVSLDALASTIAGVADAYQAKLDIFKGELVKAVWMQTPDASTHNRLLIVIHHIAVDGVSWRILVEDIEQLISASLSGNKANLAQKTSSYRQWYSALESYGKTAELLSQLSYWQQSIQATAELPVDNEYTGLVTIKDRKNQTVKLGTKETARLLQEVPKAYRTEINDILLAALAQTLTEWSGNDKITIGLEGHGRENIGEDIDTSRTVGWFTSLFPLLLNLESTSGADGLIKTVKEQLRLLPDKGLGYGVLKYINKETTLTGEEPWEIVFNYLGQLDNNAKENRWLQQATESAGRGVNDDFVVTDKLSVNCFVQAGQLVLNWGYSNCYHLDETIIKLGNDYLANLEKLINHCVAMQASAARVFTPSDFGLGADITYKELDQFLSVTDNSGKPRADLIESVYRLSGLQQGMLFHSLYDDASGAYMVQFGCDLIGTDLDIFKQSWVQVINQHTILRSAFFSDALSIPVQCVFKKAPLPLEILDYRAKAKTEQEESIREYQYNDRYHSFDFKQAPLMRIALIRISDDRYRMLWTSHHILFDGWSLAILMEEFLATYELIAEGETIKSTKVDRYEDYIRYLENQSQENGKQYWQNYLKFVETNSLLPFVKASAERNKGAGIYKSVSLQLDGVVSDKINHFAQTYRITVNTVIQGIWARLLNVYTGSSTVLYGVTVSGRPEDLPGVEQRVGMFINTVPLKAIIRDDEEVAGWLQKLQEEQVASRKYQHTPLHQIQGYTGIHGDLFDTVIVFENYPVSKLITKQQWRLQVDNVQTTEQTNYPLTIIVSSAEEINIRFSYNSGLLEEAYVEQICKHFEHALLQLIANPKAIVNDISLLTKAAENQLLFDFNDTDVNYPKGKSFIDLFEEQVADAPGKIVLVFEDEQISYQELNERSNQLAHLLISKGITKETLIPICVERSTWMILSILGILKSGAAYVPIDPAYPADRISYMLEDTASKIVISSKAARSKVAGFSAIEIIDINLDWPVISRLPVHNPGVLISENQMAYVIYTSGSTGKPKGVVLEHHNLYSFICWCRQEFAESIFDIVYASTSICFDLSVFEIFYPLSIGKPLRILENGLQIEKYLTVDSNVLTNTVPVVIQHLLQEGIDLSNIAVMNMAGEPIPIFVQQNLDTERIEVRNLYGPTEDTTYSTIFRVLKNKPVLIGKPIANTFVTIVNSKGCLVPIGVPGEICLGGDGLARGYLNRTELTSERFVTGNINSMEHARFYKTGDIGRWLSDGNIEYLGRIDNQIKIRGFRIELGEIETVLLKSGMVSNAVVLAKEDAQQNKKLVGYIVLEKGFDKEMIMSWLYAQLPDYMVPAIWVQLEILPLTPNGKIDRKALPDPDTVDMEMNKYLEPGNEFESSLAEIWQKVLGKKVVGVEDNFFELGGDSILTIQVVSRVRRLGYELQPRDIFIHPTIRSLVRAMEDRAVAAITGEQGYLSDLSGLLPIQQWYLENQQQDNDYFNQSILVGIDKEIAADELSQAVVLLLERHDALRFKYSLSDGQWQQEYGSYNGELITEDLQLISPAMLNEAITEKASVYQQSLNLTAGELIRVVWIQTPGSELNNRLFIVVHHLAIDGVSWRILLEDLELLLSAIKRKTRLELGAKSTSYRQWYTALENFGQSKALQTQLSYWEQIVKNYEALPSDKNYKGLIRIKDQATTSVALDEENTSLLLQEVPRVYHTEINDILLAALAGTISEWAKKSNVTIGLEGHGREDIATAIDTSRTVGWFTSIYPVLISLQKNIGEGDLIKSVKEQLRQIPGKGLGFGVLKYISHEPSLQGADPWDIVFNYLGQLDNVVNDSRWLSAANESTGTGRSKNQLVSEKISLNALVQGGKLQINCTYSTVHFEQSTIKRLLDLYQANLTKLIAHCLVQKKDGSVFTPSDYGLGEDISYEELDQFLADDASDDIISF